MFKKNYPLTAEDVSYIIESLLVSSSGCESALYSFKKESDKNADSLIKIFYRLGFCILNDEIYFHMPLNSFKTEQTKAFYKWYDKRYGVANNWDYPVVEEYLGTYSMPKYFYGSKDKLRKLDECYSAEELNDEQREFLAKYCSFENILDFYNYQKARWQIELENSEGIDQELNRLENLNSKAYRSLCEKIATKINGIFEEYKSFREATHHRSAV